MELEFKKAQKDQRLCEKRDREMKKSKLSKRLGAFVAASLAALTPMHEKNAKAQDVPAPIVETETQPPQSQPSGTEETPSSNEDGTETHPEEATEDGEAPGQLDMFPHDESPLFFHNFDLAEPMGEPRSEYEDPALSPSPVEVDITGQPRDIPNDNSWDLGGNIVGNEAGTAVFASFAYRDLLELRGGNIWFGPLAAPFGTVFVRPELDLWRFKLTYYGTLSGVGGLPSYLFSSHSASIGFSYPFSLDSADQNRQLWLRFGAVGGGAFDYPMFSDIYFNLTAGISLQLTGCPNSGYAFLVYGMSTFYAAAPDPMKTAYIGYYDLQWQNAETGFQMRVEDDYSLRFFANLGSLNNRYGIRGTWTVDFGEVQADLWITGGVTHWPNLLGYWRVDPMVMIGATLVVVGEDVNSSNTSSYGHLQDAGEDFAETDIARRGTGVRGFGESGDPTYDVPINEAKRRITDADSFADFAASYHGRSVADLLLVARFLGGFMHDTAYANDAQEAMFNVRIFDEAVQRIGSATTDDMFGFMQQYINWYDTHGPDEQLPDNLRSGIAVCAGIHWLIAEFLRENDINALVISVNTPHGPHVITAAQLSDRTALIDYGSLYLSGPGTLDEAIRFYGRNNGAPTFNMQVFDEDGYLATYITSEGRLLHQTLGLDNEQILQVEILDVR